MAKTPQRPIGPPRTRATIHWRLFDDGVDPYLLGLAGGLIGLALVLGISLLYIMRPAELDG